MLALGILALVSVVLTKKMNWELCSTKFGEDMGMIGGICQEDAMAKQFNPYEGFAEVLLPEPAELIASTVCQVKEQNDGSDLIWMSWAVFAKSEEGEEFVEVIVDVYFEYEGESCSVVLEEFENWDSCLDVFGINMGAVGALCQTGVDVLYPYDLLGVVEVDFSSISKFVCEVKPENDDLIIKMKWSALVQYETEGEVVEEDIVIKFVYNEEAGDCQVIEEWELCVDKFGDQMDSVGAMCQEGLDVLYPYEELGVVEIAFDTLNSFVCETKEDVIRMKWNVDVKYEGEVDFTEEEISVFFEYDEETCELKD